MFDYSSLSSLLSSTTAIVSNLWQAGKNFLSTEPQPLWQRAMGEPGYWTYCEFTSNLAHHPETALQTIISPYAVITHNAISSEIKTTLIQFLQANPENTLRFFYDDVINYLIELSAERININELKAVITFYQPYVSNEIYQLVLEQSNKLDKTNFQTQIHRIIKSLNSTFKDYSLFATAEEINYDSIETVSQAPNSIGFKQFILMSAITLLANKNNLRLGLGLATTALFAEPVGAAFPTVANPIPTQYAQPGQAFSYDIDLNHVFNDTDGDIMTFGGVTMADDSPLPSWLRVEPVLLGNCATSDTGIIIVVQNSIAYVAANSGLQFIDVNNPLAPSLMGNFATVTFENIWDLAVQNGIAYVADYVMGLQLVDVSNPIAPSLLSLCSAQGADFGVARKQWYCLCGK